MKTKIYGSTFLRLALIILVLLGRANKIEANVSILSSSFNSEFISPEFSLSSVIQNSSEHDAYGKLTSRVIDLQTGAILFEVSSGELTFKIGINTFFGSATRPERIAYASGEVGNFLRSFKKLPTGNYQYCLELEVLSAEGGQDRLCENFEVNWNDYLTLIFPPDRDTILTPLPILNWASSFPLEAKLGKRKFRLILSEKLSEQSNVEALTTNPSLYVNSDVQSFNVSYPVDAQDLMFGKTYVWQVQSYFDNRTLDVTEIWSFVLKDEPIIEPVKYVELKSKIGGEYYPLIDNKLYISFDERYGGSMVNHCSIVDIENTKISEILITDQSKGNAAEKDDSSGDPQLRHAGNNQFILDVSGINLKSGLYVLEVENQKGELFKLKFLAP